MACELVISAPVVESRALLENREVGVHPQSIGRPSVRLAEGRSVLGLEVIAHRFESSYLLLRNGVEPHPLLVLPILNGATVALNVLVLDIAHGEILVELAQKTGDNRQLVQASPT
jgi:hypothetical protein